MSEKKPRRKKNIRQDPPPPHRMMERDATVIEAVYRYRALTTDQIHRLVFTNTHISVAQRRLSLLFHNGYLERHFQPSFGNLLAGSTVYLLDRCGSDFLMAHQGYDEVRWNPDRNRIGYEYVEHLLDINSFRIEVELACQRDGFELLTWLDDTTLKQDYDRVKITGFRDPVAVIPDGFFQIRTTGGVGSFFLELDRGSMPSKRFRRKVRAYTRYKQTDLLYKRFGIKIFRVLTVTLSDKRAENLLLATREEGGKNVFWFTTLQQAHSDVVLNQPIWKLAGEKFQDSLF